MATIEITREVAAKVLSIVDKGLSSGLGQRKPGFMCVEAAVCYALDLPHGDKPDCVSPALRNLKIALNDKNWSSRAARARGLRRLAIAQLGSAGVLDDREFLKRVAEMTIRRTVPTALRIAASIQTNATHKAALIEAANRCEREGTREAAQEANKAGRAAYAATYSADAADAAAAATYSAGVGVGVGVGVGDAARDRGLAVFAENVVQILIKMEAPGCQWLPITEIAA